MTGRFPTLQTLLFYGIARLRVLVSSRSTWAVLMVGGVLVLAVMGTSAAWRARTGGAEDSTTTTIIDQTPLDDNTIREISQHPRTEVFDIATAASPLQSAPAAPPAAVSDTLPSAVSTSATDEERAQCDAEQRLRASLPRPVVSQTGVASATPRQERGRVRKALRPLPAPSRRQKTEASTSLPAVTMISVSSTAALIQRGHWRHMVQRGTRLDGWTVTRLAPTGLTLRRGRQQAVLPLSFAVRAVSAR